MRRIQADQFFYQMKQKPDLLGHRGVVFVWEKSNEVFNQMNSIPTAKNSDGNRGGEFWLKWIKKRYIQIFSQNIRLPKDLSRNSSELINQTIA